MPSTTLPSSIGCCAKPLTNWPSAGPPERPGADRPTRGCAINCAGAWPITWRRCAPPAWMCEPLQRLQCGPRAMRRRRWTPRHRAWWRSRVPANASRGNPISASCTTASGICSTSAIGSPSKQLDAGFYDLLASESRLTSLLAIAKGDVPVGHWASLGRPFFAVGAKAGLRSWSGSMFEYLMPRSGARRAAWQRAARCQPRGAARADGLRARAGRALGHLRVGLCRQRPHAGLPVRTPRRAAAGAAPHAARRTGDRAVRHGAGRADRAAPRVPELRGAGGAGATRALWLHRSARLFAGAAGRQPSRSRRWSPSWRTTRA